MRIGYSLNISRTPQPEHPLVCGGRHVAGHCTAGYVYLIRYGDLVKIGKANANKGRKGVGARKRAHDKLIGQEGVMIGALSCACAYGLERWTHKAYIDKWLTSEFFRLTEQDLRAILAISKFNNLPVSFGK